MRRGISHSGIDELRSRDVAGSHRTPIEDDAAQAASWTTRSVREVTGERTTVHLVLPDMRGRLRVVWREGERVQMGSEATASCFKVNPRASRARRRARPISRAIDAIWRPHRATIRSWEVSAL